MVMAVNTRPIASIADGMHVTGQLELYGEQCGELLKQPWFAFNDSATAFVTWIEILESGERRSGNLAGRTLAQNTSTQFLSSSHERVGLILNT